MLGFITTIILALAISFLFFGIVKDKLINGIWGTIPLAILGAWIGAYTPFFKGYGPTIDDAAIIPSIAGAAILVIIFSIFKEAIVDVLS